VRARFTPAGFLSDKFRAESRLPNTDGPPEQKSMIAVRTRLVRARSSVLSASVSGGVLAPMALRTSRLRAVRGSKALVT
jgi:hypothetical protein